MAETTLSSVRVYHSTRSFQTIIQTMTQITKSRETVGAPACKSYNLRADCLGCEATKIGQARGRPACHTVSDNLSHA